MINLDECIEWIKHNAFKKICLQLPDDLLNYSVEIVFQLQTYTQASIFVISDSAYQSCCNDKLSANHIAADACVHFGHACLTCCNDLPTFYVFSRKMINVSEFCEALYKQFQDSTAKILLFYDASYAHCIEDIYTRMARNYQHLIVSKLDCISNVKFTTATRDYSTKILGRCYNLPENVLSVSYNAIFLGPNDKVLMALALSVPVANWHYFDNSEFYSYNIRESVWLKKRNFLIEKIKDAESFGIVIASLNMTHHLQIMSMLKSILTMVNKKTYVFSIRQMNPTKLANFQEIDIFVLVSCPESSLFDTKEYFKPIVTPYEIELAFNTARKFSLFHSIDFKEILPNGVNHTNFKSLQVSDVSLTSGKIRSSTSSNFSSETNALAPKYLGSITNSRIGTSHFLSRAWTGLEQKLGEGEVKSAVFGRDGVPINYTNETSQ